MNQKYDLDYSIPKQIQLNKGTKGWDLVLSCQVVSNSLQLHELTPGSHIPLSLEFCRQEY